MWKRLFGRKPGASDENADRPVHEAARNDQEALRQLLKAAPALRDEQGWFGRQPIHVAADAGNLGSLEQLLAAGANPNAREGLHQQMPLHFAVGSDSIQCVDRLLEAGADVDAADSRGETPIFYCKSRKAIERLNAAGANLEVYSSRGQYPFQYCAAYIRSVDVIRFWLEHGIAINHVPEFGWPALNAITGMTYGPEGSPTKENDITLLELLLDHGANVSLCDKQGNPPLYDACVNWHNDFVRPLLKAGADPNQQNRAGETPLHAAVFRGTTETVRLLLENGADVNIPNLHHQTPYDISEDKPEIRSLLAPHHQPRTFPVPTADQVVERLKAIPKFRRVTLKGCSESEIDQLEQRLSVRLPQAYREFLEVMGKGAGEFMLSDRWVFRFDEVSEIAREDYSEFCDLPDNSFVFAERDGCTWAFFVAGGTSDDPPVFLFTDSEDRGYEQIGRSVWEFVESLVIDYEMWYGSDSRDEPPS